MPPRFTGPSYPCARCGSVAPMIRLSQADLRRAGYTPLGRDQYFVNWCGHGQEFITVPDTAGMWWLVPIVGRPQGSCERRTRSAGTRPRRACCSTAR
jgi:hypothetical protein